MILYRPDHAEPTGLSSRSEVSEDTIRSLRPVLRQAMKTGRAVPMPGTAWRSSGSHDDC